MADDMADAAIEEAQRMLALQPDNPHRIAHLGTVLARARRFEAAEQAFRQAIAIAPGEAALHAGLSHVLAGAGQTDAAIDVARTANALRVGDPGYQAHLGHLLTRAGRHAEAEVEFRQAFEAAPLNPHYGSSLATSLSHLSRIPDAIAVLRRVVEIEPDDPAQHRRLGEWLLQIGLAEDAMMSFRAVQKLVPGDAAVNEQVDRLATYHDELIRFRARRQIATPGTMAGPRPRVALCVVVKNEAESIGEWIAFHDCLGFDAFIILDDGSTDATTAIVSEMAKGRDVRLLTYTYERDQQPVAYHAVCQTFAGEFDWIAFIDADEFIVPISGNDIHELLDQAGDHGAIALPWLMFGSSGHVERPAGPMIAAYRRRAAVSFAANRHIKSIVRPARVRAGINAHAFDVEGGYCGPDGDPLLWQSPGILQIRPDHTAWRVQHYFTRSLAHWHARMERGQLSMLKRTLQMFHDYDRNEVLDEAALRFLEPMQARLTPRNGV